MVDYVEPSIPVWLQGVLPTPDFQVKFLKPNGEEHFVSNIGSQTWAMFCHADEMLVGGCRGGGKSKWLMAKPAMGDMRLPADDPARLSFLNDPSFRGLFLREEYQSLLEFIEEAITFYKPFGGKPAGDPKHLDFKTGARIYFNHLGDESAYTKYQGSNLTFIGVEELTQIPTLRRYLRLFGSLRSVARRRNGKWFPPLPTQMASTCNPGGPGEPWVIERFIEVLLKGGGMIPWNNIMRDPMTNGTRIFIPFAMDSNPFLSSTSTAGQSYRSRLMALAGKDEVTYRQWMHGDWHAGSSVFFSDYRPEGPVGEEQKLYPWARHRIDPVPLKPWWFRWGSGDWGYDHPAAFHKFCRNEDDHRIHVYDEMQVRRVGSFELGAMLAKWWHPELLALKSAGREASVTIHLGSDIFAKENVTKTNAEQMAAGIQEVLGPYGALLLKFNEEEQEVMMRDPKRAASMLERRKASLEGHIYIALKPVWVRRVDAWSYMRGMLRFVPAVLPLQTEEDRAKFLQQVLKEQGTAAYEMAAASMRDLKPEVLPKLQIWKACWDLDRCLKRAQRDNSAEGNPSRLSKSEDVLKFNADENGQNGDDALESARNGILAYREIEQTMPRDFWVAEQMAQAQVRQVENFGEELTDNTRLMMIARTQVARYDRENRKTGGSFSLPRASSSRHRVN